MFKCDYCSGDVGPRVPLRLMTVPGEERNVEYHNTVVRVDDRDREYEEEVHTKGKEITAEYKVCPVCAGMKPVIEAKPDHSVTVALFSGIRAHGQKCKKQYVECEMCKKNELAARSAPVDSITHALQEVQARRFTQTIASVAVENLIARSGMKSKRALSDFNVTYGLLKQYERRGGGLR